MTIFVESPWPALALFFVLEVILGFVFLRSGRWWAVAGMVGVLAGTVGLVLLERAVITDVEEVEDTLHGVAELLDANNAPRVLESFVPECPRLAEVRRGLSEVTIRSASIGGDLEVRLSQLTNPPSATAYFTGHIEAHDNSGTIPYEHFVRKFKVKLERRNGLWLIVDFEDANPGGKRLP